jgi:hypothetical protein
MSTCEFTLTKHNYGRAFGYVYLLSTQGSQQTVGSGMPIKFNNFNKLAGVAWLTQPQLTVLKTATFQIDFSLNYATQPNIQVALFINGNAMIGSFGISSPLTNGTSQLKGTYVLRLNMNDTIQLVNISSPFILKPASLDNEIIATITVTEQ